MARRFPLATTFNMIGLIAAYALFYLLMTQLIYQNSYNHPIDDSDKIYRLETDYVYSEWAYSDMVCRPFADALKHLPEVESYSLFQYAAVGTDLFDFKKDSTIIELPFTIGNNTVVSTLTKRKLSGDITFTDDDTDGIIIPKSAALKYFDSIDVAGKQMTLLYEGEDIHYTVRGVYDDFPENCEFHNRIYSYMGDSFANDINSLFKCYVKFKRVPDNMDAFCEELKQSVLADLEAKKGTFENVEEFNDLKYSFTETRFKLTPIGKTYYEHNTYTTDAGSKGYNGSLPILGLGCLFVIFIATINFLNFTLAESPMRVRGINTRLVLGASRRSLRLWLLAECIIVSVIACIIALLLCQLLSHLPSLCQLLEGDMSVMKNKLIVLALLGLSAIVGVFAGFYPAVFATSFPPAIALKSSFGLTPQGVKLRTILVCLQLFLSLLMSIYIGILLLQNYHIFNSEYGFEKDHILSTYIPYDIDIELKQQLCHELNKIDGVENVSMADSPLGSTDGHSLLRTDVKDHHFRYRFIVTDHNYLKTMGINVIEGRDFQENDTAVAIINQTTRKQIPEIGLGTAITIGIDEEAGDSAVVVGVCDNIHYGTMRINNNQCFCIIYKPYYPYNQHILMRIANDADKKRICQQANELVKHYCGPNNDTVDTFEEMLTKTYHNEFRFFRQTYLITIICLVLTIIGIFCLTLFETEYRRKEIGIRKVAGATTREIVWMLCRHYGLYIIICFIAAAPIAYICGKLTISHFADHTEIYWWIYPLALLLVGGITIGTVVLQSWRAARENPVNSIKTE